MLIRIVKYCLVIVYFVCIYRRQCQPSFRGGGVLSRGGRKLQPLHQPRQANTCKYYTQQSTINNASYCQQARIKLDYLRKDALGMLWLYHFDYYLPQALFTSFTSFKLPKSFTCFEGSIKSIKLDLFRTLQLSFYGMRLIPPFPPQ